MGNLAAIITIMFCVVKAVSAQVSSGRDTPHREFRAKAFYQPVFV